MLRFIRGAWWVLWHPGQALLVGLFAIALILAPEVAILWLLVAHQLQQVERRLEAGPRVITGPGFTMRDLAPEERAR